MSFEKVIEEYLQKRAEKDSEFAKKFANEDKSVKECCSYIIGEVRRRSKGSSSACLPDEEVFGLAVHYYDEDSAKLKIPKDISTNAQVEVEVELSEEDKRAAHERAVEEYKRYCLEKMKAGESKKAEKKAARRKQEPELPNLFSF